MGSDRGKTCVCIHHNDFINISLNGKKKHVKKRVVGYEINKDAAIKTFILRVDQMTTWMWKLSLDTHFMKLFSVFHLNGLVLRPAALFWITLTALISIVSSRSIQWKAQTDKEHLVNIVEHLHFAMMLTINTSVLSARPLVLPKVAKNNQAILLKVTFKWTIQRLCVFVLWSKANKSLLLSL